MKFLLAKIRTPVFVIEERIDLTMNAQRLITELLKAGVAFDKFDAASARVASNLIKFDKTGDAVGRQLVLLDKHGKELRASLFNVEKEMEAVDAQGKNLTKTVTQVDVAVRNLTKDQVKAAEAAKKLTTALRRQATDARKAGADPTRREAVRLETAIDSLRKVQTEAGVTQKRVENLFTAFRAGNFRVKEGEEALRRAILEVITAKEQLGATSRKEQAARLAAQQKIVAAQEAEAEALRRTLAARAQARGGTALRTPIPSPTGPRAGFRPTRGEEEAFLRAEKAFATLSARSDEFARDARIAFDEARRGVLTYQTAVTDTERVAVQLQTAINSLGAAAKKEADEAAAAQQKVIKAQRERAVLQRQIRGGSAIPGAQDATEAEINAFRRAEKALIDLQARGKATGADIRAAIDKARLGVIDLKTATNETELAAVRLAQAEEAFGTAAQAAADKAFAARLRAAQQRAEENRRLREQITLEREAAAIRSGALRDPGIDLRTIKEGGRATQAQVQAFIQAEQSLARLRLSGKATFTEINTAILAARNNTLQLAQATTAAEQAALRLVAAERAVAVGAKQAQGAISQIGASITDLGRLVGISLVIGGAFRLVSVLTEAAEQAGELSIKIAEVETISARAAFATEEWAASLRELSSAFGIDVLDQAEAAYQVLSNQIKNAAGETLDGAEAIKFLAVANELAITGVTDTAAATNLLTAALNSFNRPAEDAGIIAAQLFKTVELGRLRIEEMSESFGRIAVPANQLGVTMEELLGAIAQTTIQGVKFNEASTLIRNVILKLLRPTDEMKRIFQELGVASGEALIASRGFTDALAAIENRVGGTSTELGKAFGRIRAITGALIFAGEGADEAQEKIDEIRKVTLQSFGEDTQRVIRSTGQQLAIAGQEARNFFEREIGTPALQAIAKWIDEAGGMERILRDIIREVTTFTKLFLVAFGLKSLTRLFEFARGMTAVAAATNAATAAQKRYNLALLASPVGVLAAIGAAFAGVTEIISRAATARLQAEEDANLSILKANDQLKAARIAAESEFTRRVNQEIDRRTQPALLANAEILADQIATGNKIAENAKKISDQFKVLIADFRKSVSAQLSEAEGAAKKFTKTATDAGELVRKIVGKEAQAQFTIDLNVAGTGRQIRLLEAEILKSRERVENATADGNLKLFEEERKRLNQLIKQRIDAQVKLTRETSKLDLEREDANFQLLRSRSRAEREIARERLEDIRRQSILIKQGTEAQLEQEREIQKLRGAVREAEDEAAFAKALRQLSALKREQERLNAVAAIERRLRAETAKEAAKQAAQAERIRKANEERAKQERAEAARLRALQLAFDLVSKEATAFKDARITEGKTEEEIAKAVAEQQKRFAQLITLSRALGGGRQTDLILLRRDISLREQAENRIAQIRTEARAKALADLREELKQSLANAKEERKAQLGNLDIIERRVRQFQTLTERGLLRTGRDDIGRGAVLRQAFALQPTLAPGAFEGESEAVLRAIAAKFDRSIELARDLNNEILAQRVDFSQERQVTIREIVQQLRKNLQADVARGTAAVQQIEQRGGFVSPARRELLARSRELLVSIASVEAQTKKVGDQQAIIDRAIAALPEEERAKERANQATNKETEARKKHIDALNEATKAINEFRKTSTEREPARRFPVVRPAQLGEILGQAGTTPLTPEQAKVLADGINAGLEEVAGKTKDQFKTETETGTAEGVDAGIKQARDAQKKAAEEAGRAQAEANAEKQLELAPELAKQIAELESEIKERQEQTDLRKRRGPQFQPRDLSKLRTFQLGQGAPPLSEQKRRLREALKEEARRRRAFAKERIKFEEEERARRRVRSRGRTGIGRGGELVTRGRGRFTREGEFVTGQGRFDREGNLVTGRGRVGPDGRISVPTPVPTDEAKRTAAATERTAEEIAKQNARAEAENKQKAASDKRLAEAARAAGLPATGTGRIDGKPVSARGTEEAKEDLKKLLAKRKEAQAAEDIADELQERFNAIKTTEEERRKRDARIQQFEAIREGLSEEAAEQLRQNLEADPLPGLPDIKVEPSRPDDRSQRTGAEGTAIGTILQQGARVLPGLFATLQGTRAQATGDQETSITGFDEEIKRDVVNLFSRIFGGGEGAGAGVGAGAGAVGGAAGRAAGRGPEVFNIRDVRRQDATPIQPNSEELRRAIQDSFGIPRAEDIAAPEIIRSNEEIRKAISDLGIQLGGGFQATPGNRPPEGITFEDQMKAADAQLDTSELTTEALKRLQQAAEAAAKAAEEELRKRQQIDELFRQMEGNGLAAGGIVRGSIGRDRVPAMLTSGEFVMNRRATQRFFPQLMSMNSGRFRPRSFQDGGITGPTNIRVTVNESSSPQATSREVIRGINRELRRGTIRLHGR